MTHYKYENGVFVEDTENYKKIGKKTAITTYTGGVLIINDFYYDRQKNRYYGKCNNQNISVRPSQIIDMKVVA